MRHRLPCMPLANPMPAKMDRMIAVCHSSETNTDPDVPTWIENDAPWLNASLLGMFCCSLQLLANLVAHIAVCDVLLLLHCGRVAAHVHQNVRHAQLCHL